MKERFEQCVCTLIFKFLSNNVPEYIKEMFTVNNGKYNTRNPNMLKRPFYKTSNGQKAISYIGPKLWDSMPNYLKEKRTIASFKHEYKSHYLRN